ncbi:MAG: hypothetical protein MJA29_13695 [Candidatus Omnitrophica bacterium]|nr:hypothetical protein [Candidatus Omnitrophota bacterium]
MNRVFIVPVVFLPPNILRRSAAAELTPHPLSRCSNSFADPVLSPSLLAFARKQGGSMGFPSRLKLFG